MADTRKSVLITGCSPGGIGHSLALSFSSKGARVLATARSTSVLTDLANHGIETLSLTVDDPASIAACKAQVASLTGGKLEYLINNAGRNYTVPALDVDIAEVRATFETNVVGVVAMCQAFAPLLIEARGTIVQIGSVAATMPYVFGSVYNASKAAVHAYSNTLRVELAPFGVDVVTIVTGGVTSRIARTHRELPAGSYYEPIKDEYERRLTHSQARGTTMPNERYARSVVNQVWERRRRPWYVWEGAKSWLVWFMVTFTSLGVHNRIFTRMFGLHKLKAAHAAGTAKKLS